MRLQGYTHLVATLSPAKTLAQESGKPVAHRPFLLREAQTDTNTVPSRGPKSQLCQGEKPGPSPGPKELGIDFTKNTKNRQVRAICLAQYNWEETDVLQKEGATSVLAQHSSPSTYSSAQ